jgi:hypothetical protein
MIITFLISLPPQPGQLVVAADRQPSRSGITVKAWLHTW